MELLERMGVWILGEPKLVAIGAILLVLLVVRMIVPGGPPGRY
jgi:hypothetical protein